MNFYCLPQVTPKNKFFFNFCFYRLVLDGYKFVQNDYPGNVRRGGVFSYFRESRPVRCRSNLLLNKCLIFDVSVNNKKGYVVSLHRSASQTSDEFEAFRNNVEKLIAVTQILDY